MIRIVLVLTLFSSCTIETSLLEPVDALPHSHELEEHTHDWSNIASGPRDGRTGIGITDPSAVVHVRGTLAEPLTGTVSVLAGTDLVSGAGTFFSLELRAGDAIQIDSESFTVERVESDESFVLDTQHMNGASNTIAYVDPTLFSVDSANGLSQVTVTKHGDVGINTDTPQAKLHVNGDILCSGGIRGPTGAMRLDINAFSSGANNNGTAQDHSVYVNGELVSTAGRAVHLTVLSGEDGSIIFSNTFDTHADQIGQGAALANNISNFDRDSNILILNTFDQPSDISSQLASRLINTLKSTRIVNEGVAYRGAFAIAYQNNRGKLAEDVSNQPGGAVQYGDGIRANASVHFVTYVGW